MTSSPTPGSSLLLSTVAISTAWTATLWLFSGPRWLRWCWCSLISFFCFFNFCLFGLLNVYSSRWPRRESVPRGWCSGFRGGPSPTTSGESGPFSTGGANPRRLASSADAGGAYVGHGTTPRRDSLKSCNSPSHVRNLRSKCSPRVAPEGLCNMPQSGQWCGTRYTTPHSLVPTFRNTWDTQGVASQAEAEMLYVCT